ncbi:UNVERIFIED_ORG: hypothetical protein M2402_004880 [Rahnella aquatilis]
MRDIFLHQSPFSAFFNDTSIINFERSFWVVLNQPQLYHIVKDLLKVVMGIVGDCGRLVIRNFLYIRYN